MDCSVKSSRRKIEEFDTIDNMESCADKLTGD